MSEVDVIKGVHKLRKKAVKCDSPIQDVYHQSCGEIYVYDYILRVGVVAEEDLLHLLRADGIVLSETDDNTQFFVGVQKGIDSYLSLFRV
jgi:hypothetical protein